MFLQEDSYEDKSARRLLLVMMRNLAGTYESSNYSTEERRQRVANMFCVSMSVGLICMELSEVCHVGTKDYLGYAKCKSGRFIVLFRACLVVFVATISQYTTDPDEAVLIGLAALICEVGVCVLGDFTWKKVWLRRGRRTLAKYYRTRINTQAPTRRSKCPT